MKKTITASLLLLSLQAFAQMTPVGTWHTIDDETKKPKGEVTITDTNGVLTGVVGKSLVDDPKAKTICDLCKDDRKDQAHRGHGVHSWCQARRQQTRLGRRRQNPRPGQRQDLHRRNGAYRRRQKNEGARLHWPPLPHPSLVACAVIKGKHA